MDLQPDDALLTVNEIDRLSPQARQILAARCAARVLPVLGQGGNFKYWGGEAQRHVAGVAAAVAVALLRGVGHELAEGLQSATATAASYAAIAAGHAAEDTGSPFAYVYAARVAARAAEDATEDATEDANAAIDNARAATRADWQRLTESEDPTSLLSVDLWPVAPPPKWEALTDRFRLALDGIGRNDLFQRYRELEKGYFDPEGWQVLLDRWWREYGEESVVEGESKIQGSAQVPSQGAETKRPSFNDDAYRGGLVATQTRDAAAVEDHLGRAVLVEALAALLAHPSSEGQLTIGLLGHWGAGKSSILNLLTGALKERGGKGAGKGEGAPYLFSTFNAWSYEHTGNIQAGLAQEVVNGLTGDLSPWRRLTLAVRYAAMTRRWSFWGTAALLSAVMAGTIWRGWSGTGIEAAGGVVLLGVLMWHQGKELFSHPLAAKLQTYLRLPSFGEHLGELPVIQRQVRDLCRLRLEDPEAPKRLLFMVDDLDRCGVAGVVKTLEAVRLVMDLPKVTVIVAVDHRMALAALTHHYHDLAEKGSARTPQAIARDYLGKIFQLPIQLEEPTEEGVEEYVNAVLFPGVEERKGGSGKPGTGVDVGSGTGVGGGAGAGDGTGSGAGIGSGAGTGDGAGSGGGDAGGAGTDERTAIGDGLKHKPDPNEALADTPSERERFGELARMMKMGNPRQLKRLHNCYRLLKALHYHDGHGPLGEDRRSAMMAMLFWLEHLYELESEQRERMEGHLKDASVPLDGAPPRRRLTPGVFEELGSEFGIDPVGDPGHQAYGRLKAAAIPLMLPFALLRHESREPEGGAAEKAPG